MGHVHAQTPAYTLYGSSSGAAATTIYAYNFSSTNTFVDQTTAINTGLNYVNGLAWGGTTANRLFYRAGTDTGAGSGSGTFYNWNRGTGAQTAMTQNGGVSISTLSFASAAFYNNAYWTVPTNTNDLYRVTFNASFTTYTAELWVSNVNNGAAADQFTFGDIAISTGGVLYGFGTTNGNAQFFSGTIPAAAAATLSNPITPVNRGTETNMQLGFSQGGSVLYGATLAAGSWHTVDTATGARSSSISGIPTTTLTDLSSAATYQPVPAPPAAVCLGIGGVVGLVQFGVGKRQRRKKK